MGWFCSEISLNIQPDVSKTAEKLPILTHDNNERIYTSEKKIFLFCYKSQNS
jgi:hypothetical protein